nr:MAG TPA: hypothetical protein [Caudoviricetes sp.]DAW69850.1 MAG TPA: hypothetical protein [Caudoviricetes sp.]
MQVKGANGIEFELADEVATAMITAGILEEVTPDSDPPEQEPAKKSKK